MLEADVNFKVVRDFIKKVTDRAVGADVINSLLPAQQIVKIVNEELTALMGGANERIHLSSRPPTVIMMVGLQGAGKTTHCGKIAGAFKKQGRRPLLVACDVYRPAAVKQLEVIGEQLDIPVFSMGTVFLLSNCKRRALNMQSGMVTISYSSTPPDVFISMKK